MDNLVVKVEPRASFGKGANRRLRAKGMVPAVIYGQQKDAVPVSVDNTDLIRILRSHAGSNTIFGVQVKGAKGTENVMIKDYQLEPVEHFCGPALCLVLRSRDGRGDHVLQDVEVR